MAGPETPELAAAAVAGGADLVEIGFPFSDPLADGPTIRLAAERALAEGMRTAACLECLASTRERVDVPLVPDDLRRAPRGVRLDAIRGRRRALRCDLADRRRPAGRSSPGASAASTSSPRRRATSGSRSPPTARTDGSTSSRSPERPARATSCLRSSRRSSRATRRLSDVPLYAGFGISTPAHAAAAAELADGIVVGSAALTAAEDGAGALERFVASLRAAIS